MSKSSEDPSTTLAFFAEELSNDNRHHRVFAANNIYLVAAAVGQEFARRELMTFLATSSQFDREVQLLIAAQLGELIKFLGGPEWNYVLLGPLKILASSEEQGVREKALESMKIVCNVIPEANVNATLIQYVKEMSSSELFTLRASASSFILIVYPKLNEQNKTNCLNFFKSLAKDETPMVRRNALQVLPRLIEFIPKNALISEINKEIVIPFLQDEEDSIRLLLPAVVSAMSDKTSDAEKATVIYSTVKALSRDNSWRVRSAIGNVIPEIVKGLQVEVIMNEFGPVIIRLLRDAEPEVKIAGIMAISSILPLIASQNVFVLEKLLPAFSQLSKDNSDVVKREVSFHIMEFAPIVGGKSVQDIIIPFISKIMSDEDDEAKCSVLTSILLHSENVDLIPIIQVVLPFVRELPERSNWHIKCNFAKLFPLFAKALGLEQFSLDLFPLINTWLSDPIFGVRDQTVKQLGPLVQVFGVEWAESVLTPSILQFKTNQCYLIRQVTLYCILNLRDYLPIHVYSKQYLPTVLYMSNDRIANVKILVVKTLLQFIGSTDQKVCQQIQSSLKSLSNSSDADVKYFASSAFLKC